MWPPLAGDGLFHISVLFSGLLAFPAHARGALCCLPATVHQDSVHAGSPGEVARAGGATGSPVSTAVTLVCGVHKPVFRSSQSSQVPWMPTQVPCTFWISFRPCSSRGLCETSLESHSYFTSPVTQPTKWKGEQREPLAAGEGTEKTHRSLTSWTSQSWSLRPLGSGSAGPHPLLLGSLCLW